MEFKDKIVLVTGSTRGIGRSVAEAFAQQGATSIIIGRSQETVDALCKDLVDKGLNVDGYSCDVSNLENVQETVNKVLDKHKRIDILINNAGITKDNLLLRLKEDDWDQVISVNLKGVFNFTKAVTKSMLKARQGKIINIASIIGIIGNAGQANYAASKAGVIGFSKSVAKELASRGITVNVIAPGYIETDMTDELGEKAKEEVLKQVPLGRLGIASDIAGVSLFLASQGANYITGQTIVVDGGMAI